MPVYLHSYMVNCSQPRCFLFGCCGLTTLRGFCPSHVKAKGRRPVTIALVVGSAMATAQTVPEATHISVAIGIPHLSSAWRPPFWLKSYCGRKSTHGGCTSYILEILQQKKYISFKPFQTEGFAHPSHLDSNLLFLSKYMLTSGMSQNCLRVRWIVICINLSFEHDKESAVPTSLNTAQVWHDTNDLKPPKLPGCPVFPQWGGSVPSPISWQK